MAKVTILTEDPQLALYRRGFVQARVVDTKLGIIGNTQRRKPLNAKLNGEPSDNNAPVVETVNITEGGMLLNGVVITHTVPQTVTDSRDGKATAGTAYVAELV